MKFRVINLVIFVVILFLVYANPAKASTKVNFSLVILPAEETVAPKEENNLIFHKDDVQESYLEKEILEKQDIGDTHVTLDILNKLQDDDLNLNLKDLIVYHYKQGERTREVYINST